MKKQFSRITLMATFVFAVAFTLSCGNHTLDDLLETKCGGKEYDASEFSCVSGELVGKCKGVDYYPDYQICNNGQIEDKNLSGGSSSVEEWNLFGNENTFRIESMTQSSFTQTMDLYCLETLGNSNIGKISYSKNGTTLSFWGLEFNGNSSSIMGTWTREPYSATCEENDSNCKGNNNISKAMFTQNSVTYTTCIGEIGTKKISDSVTVKTTDCNTREYSNGTEKVIEKVYSDYRTATYKSKTCRTPEGEGSILSMCTWLKNAYEKDGVVMDENSEDYDLQVFFGLLAYIVSESFDSKCLEDNNFPEWFLASYTSAVITVE